MLAYVQSAHDSLEMSYARLVTTKEHLTTATYTVVHQHVTKEEFEEARLLRAAQRATNKKPLDEEIQKLRAESAKLARQILEMERRRKGRK